MGPNTTSRRNFLKFTLMGAGAISVPSLIAGCGGSSTNTSSGGPTAAVPTDIDAKWPQITSKEVVLAGFGGETYEVRHSLLFDPFTKLSGATVVDAPWDYGKYVNMIDSKSPEWDMIDFDGYSVVALIEGGTPPAKLEDWVRRCDLVDPEYQDYAAGSYAYSVVLGWSQQLDSAPGSWTDFFDTSKFEGKRAFPKSIYAGTAEIALIADGVSPEDLYPLDFDRAFAKLDTIKDDLIFYDSYAQGPAVPRPGQRLDDRDRKQPDDPGQSQGRGRLHLRAGDPLPLGRLPDHPERTQPGRVQRSGRTSCPTRPSKPKSPRNSPSARPSPTPSTC